MTDNNSMPVSIDTDMTGQYNQFLDAVDHLNSQMAVINLRLNLLRAKMSFAALHHVQPAESQNYLADIDRSYITLKNQTDKLSMAVMLLRTYRAGLSIRSDGDFDIVAEKDVLSEHVKDAATLNGLPWIIAGSVAVVALVVGAIATVKALNYQGKKIDAAARNAEREIEKKILAKPELIEPYAQYRETIKENKTHGLIDKIFGKGAGRDILSGVGGVLLVLGIGWAVWRWTNNDTKRLRRLND